MTDYFWPIAAMNSNSTTTGAWGSQFIAFNGDGIAQLSSGTKATVSKKNGMPIKIFFSLMKKKMGILAGLQLSSRIAKLEKMIVQADKSGQIALSEDLMKKIFIAMKESELYANGYKIFLNAQIYQDFCEKTPRKVALTKMKNYARVIPDDVLDKKAECDKLKLFDEYFVMHYDGPDTVKETAKDKVEKRAKDPILFGAVEHSERLYYIADWEDEFCDLTLDDIVDKLNLKDADITIPKNPTL